MLVRGDFLMNTVSVRPLLLSEGAHAFQGYSPYGASGCNFPVSYGTIPYFSTSVWAIIKQFSFVSWCQLCYPRSGMTINRVFSLMLGKPTNSQSPRPRSIALVSCAVTVFDHDRTCQIFADISRYLLYIYILSLRQYQLQLIAPLES